MESDNAVFITFTTPWDLLNMFRAIASGWSLQIHADVTSKASTSALNKLNLGVNQLCGHYAPWSSSLIPAESESSATYIEAYKAASAASRIKECTFVEPGFRMQEQLVKWLVSKEEPDAAEWFKRYWSCPRNGRWIVGNGGVGTIANQLGIESTFKWEREDISHCKQVNLDLSAVCVILI
jgi:hypothetical protein